jgi:CMP/dCMP deaminase zinc-binding
MNKELIDKIIDNSKCSLSSSDVPVGALIIKDGVIIASGYNTREKNQNVLEHAEINAIREAQKIFNNWNFNGCDMYVTLKPCSMCMEVIKQARISNVYFLAEKPSSKVEFNRTNLVKINNDSKEKEYLEILSDFFKKLREK